MVHMAECVLVWDELDVSGGAVLCKPRDVVSLEGPCVSPHIFVTRVLECVFNVKLELVVFEKKPTGQRIV